MAQTYAASGLTPQQWDDDFFKDYVRSNRFKRYMAKDESAIIQVKEDLMKKKGDTITYALVNELNGAGRTGNQKLKGYEEPLSSRSHALTVNVLRHAVTVDEWDQQKSAIDLRNAARPQIREWSMKKLRDDIVSAFGSIDGTAYASASEANKDTWLTNNDDRVLFGAAKSNNSSNDHSASLANIDNTTDKLDPDMISLAKRMAQTASPKIRPITLMEDEEWYVMFCNSLSFRDLAANSTMQQANREARARGMQNPLFTGGSLVWDGVIIREIPEIAVISGVGASSIDVAPNYLCGAQAIGVGWAQRSKTTTDVDDFDFQYGVGVQEIRGVEKLRFGSGASDTTTPQDHGVVTVYSAGVADS